MTAAARSGGVRAVRLPNGLVVLLREMRQAPVVSVWCWYRVGSRDERPNRQFGQSDCGDHRLCW